MNLIARGRFVESFFKTFITDVKIDNDCVNGCYTALALLEGDAPADIPLRVGGHPWRCPTSSIGVRNDRDAKVPLRTARLSIRAPSKPETLQRAGGSPAVRQDSLRRWAARPQGRQVQARSSALRLYRALLPPGEGSRLGLPQALYGQ